MQEIWGNLPPGGCWVCVHHRWHLHQEASVKNGASGAESALLWSGCTHHQPVSHSVLPQSGSWQTGWKSVNGETQWAYLKHMYLSVIFKIPSRFQLPVCVTCPVFLQYFGELSLVDSEPFLKYLPSQTAAAAYTLANNIVSGGSWVSFRFSMGRNQPEVAGCDADDSKW